MEIQMKTIDIHFFRMLVIDRDQVISTTVCLKLIRICEQTIPEKSCYSKNNFSESKQRNYSHISCFIILEI